MPDHPTNRPWKQVLPIALLILGVGFYGQYTSAAGVFSADGLLPRAERLVERLLQPPADALPAALPAELAEEILESPPPANALTNSFAVRGRSAPLRESRSFAGGFGHCPPSHCPSNYR